MVNFEKSSPEEQSGLVRSQWYGDAGVGRGVDPEVAKDLGYTDPTGVKNNSAGGDSKPRWSGKGLVPKSVTDDLQPSQPHRTPEEIEARRRQMEEALDRETPPEAA